MKFSKIMLTTIALAGVFSTMAQDQIVRVKNSSDKVMNVKVLTPDRRWTIWVDPGATTRIGSLSEKDHLVVTPGAVAGYEVKDEKDVTIDVKLVERHGRENVIITKQ